MQHEKPTLSDNSPSNNKTDVWMPMFWRDYFADTAWMTEREEAVYFRLIGHYWLNRGPLPADRKHLMRLARISGKGAAAILETVLNKCFVFPPKGGKTISHKRIDAELAKAAERRRIAQENGKKGGRPNPKKHNPAGIPEHNPQKSSSPSPVHVPVLTGVLSTELAKAAVERWFQYKKERGEKYKPAGAQALIKKLTSWGADDAIAAIDEAMSNNWAGVFRPKKSHGRQMSIGDRNQEVLDNYKPGEENHDERRTDENVIEVDFRHMA